MKFVYYRLPEEGKSGNIERIITGSSKVEKKEENPEGKAAQILTGAIRFIDGARETNLTKNYASVDAVQGFVSYWIDKVIPPEIRRAFDDQFSDLQWDVNVALTSDHAAAYYRKRRKFHPLFETDREPLNYLNVDYFKHVVQDFISKYNHLISDISRKISVAKRAPEAKRLSVGDLHEEDIVNHEAAYAFISRAIDTLPIEFVDKNLYKYYQEFTQDRGRDATLKILNNFILDFNGNVDKVNQGIGSLKAWAEANPDKMPKRITKESAVKVAKKPAAEEDGELSEKDGSQNASETEAKAATEEEKIRTLFKNAEIVTLKNVDYVSLSKGDKFPIPADREVVFVYNTYGDAIDTFHSGDEIEIIGEKALSIAEPGNLIINVRRTGDGAEGWIALNPFRPWEQNAGQVVTQQVQSEVSTDQSAGTQEVKTKPRRKPRIREFPDDWKKIKDIEAARLALIVTGRLLKSGGKYGIGDKGLTIEDVGKIVNYTEAEEPTEAQAQAAKMSLRDAKTVKLAAAIAKHQRLVGTKPDGRFGIDTYNKSVAYAKKHNDSNMAAALKIELPEEEAKEDALARVTSPNPEAVKPNDSWDVEKVYPIPKKDSKT